MIQQKNGNGNLRRPPPVSIINGNNDPAAEPEYKPAGTSDQGYDLQIKESPPLTPAGEPKDQWTNKPIVYQEEKVLTPAPPPRPDIDYRFIKNPKELEAVYKDPDQVVEILPQGKEPNVDDPNVQEKPPEEIVLSEGNYTLKYATEETDIDKSKVGTIQIVNYGGQEKRYRINSADLKNGYVEMNIDLIQNPIPLIVLGYAAIAILGLGTGGYFLSEFNKSVNLLTPALIAAGVIMVLQMVKK